MLFPLGLGLHFARVPIITLLIAIALFVSFLVKTPSAKQIDKDVETILEKSQMTSNVAKIFYEYCTAQKGNAGACQILKDQMANQRRKKNLDKSTGLRQIIKLSSIVEKFKRELKTPTSDLTSLPSYATYAQAKEILESEMAEMQQRDGLLSRSNITPGTVFWAQFRHGDFIHLLSNLFALIVFGSYVELRMGALLYLGTYFYGGFLGLFLFFPLTTPSPTHLVGASANISALMGAFFILFFRFRMKFLFYFIRSRTFFAQVSVYFPLLYICNDLIGAATASENVFGGGVAHSAHLVGLCLGMIMGGITTWLSPLRWPFTYLTEDEVTAKVIRTPELSTKMQLADHLLELNPENLVVRHAVLSDLVSNTTVSEQSRHSFLRTHLTTCVAVLVRMKQTEKAFALLSRLPLEMRFNDLLAGCGKRTFLKLGDYAVDTGKLPLALLLYEAFVLKFSKTKEAKAVQKTMASILERAPFDSTLSKFLDRYRAIQPKSLIFSLWPQSTLPNVRAS